MITDAAKEFLDGRRFGIVGYTFVIIHFLFGVGVTTYARVLSLRETEKFSCSVDAQSTNVHKKQVDQTCLGQYGQTYNSPLPLFDLAILSFGCAILVSISYSLIVRTRVDEIESSYASQNDGKSKTPVVDNELSNEDKAKNHENRKTVYVFVSYFLHLVVRVSLGTAFTAAQYKYFNASGFPVKFTCNYNYTAVVSCENPTASQKSLASILVCVANGTVVLFQFAEVIYLSIRLAIRRRRYKDSINVDFEFVIEYFLGKKYRDTTSQASASTGSSTGNTQNAEEPLVEILCTTGANNTQGDSVPLTVNSTQGVVRSEVVHLPSTSKSDAQEYSTDDTLNADCGIIQKECTGIMDNSIQQSISKYKDEVLKRRSREINYIPNKSLDDFYVDIVFQPGRARDELSKDRKREKVDDIPTSTCSIKELFQPNEDTAKDDTSSILVVGRPGIGKTVLTEKILRDWANETDDHYRDKVACIVKIRNFNAGIQMSSDVSLKEFLHYETSLTDDEFERIYEEITDKPQNAILIFDGLDEFNGNYMDYLDEVNRTPNKPDLCMPPMNLFVKLVRGDILKGATVLVTSRPSAAKSYAKIGFTQEVEICGFENDQIQAYVTRFCENQETNNLKPKILEHIESTPKLLELCKIPVTCFLVCVSLWGSLCDSKSTNDTSALPTTLTDLFQKVLCYFQTYEQNRNDGIDVYPVKEETLKKLQKLAFDGVKNGQQFFNQKQVDEQIKKSCFLNTLSNPAFPIEAEFCFIHKTLQEFLAAKHVTEKNNVTKIKKFISDHLANKRWQMVLLFIAGLLGKEVKKLEAQKLYKDCVLAFTDVSDNTGNMFLKEMDLNVEIEKDIYNIAGMGDVSSDVSSQSRKSDIPESTSEQAAVPLVCKQEEDLANLNSHGQHLSSEKPQSWKWTQKSIRHQEKFERLREVAQVSPHKIKEINGVRVCFEEEFRIGRGIAATKVNVGLAKDGYEKAVKRLPRDIVDFAEQEKKILNQANVIESKHVVNYWFLDDESDPDWVFLIMDLCEETLQDYVDASHHILWEEWSEKAPCIIRDILTGLAHLHGEPNPVLHRDLKPSNVLSSVHDKWLLADFGISRILPRDETTHVSMPRGTKDWIAVESCPSNYKSDNVQVRYKTESDIQVAGMVAFYVLTKGEHPFGELPDRLRNLLDGNRVYLDKLKDPVAKDLISWMLNHDCKDRPSAKEALKHPYLLPKEELFELLQKIGNQREVKTGDKKSDVVTKLNSNPTDWQRLMGPDILNYLSTVNAGGGSRIRQYGSSWTECLRLIRNVSLHWNDQPHPFPQPEAFYNVGDPKEYFLKTFPGLAVEVHRIVRSSAWKERPKLKNCFT